MTPVDLAVPDVRIGGPGDVGRFRSPDAFARFLETYRRGMMLLPPFTLHDVSTAFGTVRAYRFDGPAGPPVVLLPGRNASTPMYRANLPTLLQRRTVYSLDLLGEAGLSVQDTAIRSADDQARWLGETLGGLGLDAAHLLGVSIGGWTAVNGAVRHPDRIASLTLLDPVFTFAKVPLAPMLAAMAMLAPGVPERLRRRVLSWISGGAGVDDAEPEAALIDSAARAFVLRQPIPRLFTDDQLRSLDIPVLALIGGRSVMLDAARAADRARRLLPRGEVEVWPQASHAINGEYAEEIAERAGVFWDRVDARD